MQVTDEVVRNVVEEVLSRMRNGRRNQGPTPKPHRPREESGRAHTNRPGVFADVDRAVAAATDAQKQFERRGLEDRQKAVDCIRRVCIEQAEQLGREELEETRIGRLEHKIEKLVIAGEKVPGVEFLRSE